MKYSKLYCRESVNKIGGNPKLAKLCFSVVLANTARSQTSRRITLRRVKQIFLTFEHLHLQGI